MMTERTNRRDFLGLGIAGLGTWMLGRGRTGLPGFGGEGPVGEKDRILVVLQMSGGNDGLNTVVPHRDPEYRKLRKVLGLPSKEIHDLGDGFGLHPALGGCAELVRGGRMAWIRGIGYPNPNRSHFKSMDIWHAADPTARDLRYGWLGRALDEIAAGTGPRADLGVNLAAKVPLAMNGRRSKPISFLNPETYRYRGTEKETRAFSEMVAAAKTAGNPILARLRRTAGEAVDTSAEIRKAVASYRTPVRYPQTPIGRSLRNVAALIGGGIGSRVFYTYHNGFDTHVNQPNRHGNLLRQLDQALTAFQKDLERNGAADRVVLFGFSEFGRRARENRSNGTDHGCAGTAFLLGTRVRGGLHGRYPSLTDLDKGDLRFTTDFRGVYATLCGDWLGLDSRKVLGGTFESLPLLG